MAVLELELAVGLWSCGAVMHVVCVNVSQFSSLSVSPSEWGNRERRRGAQDVTGDGASREFIHSEQHNPQSKPRGPYHTLRQMANSCLSEA